MFPTANSTIYRNDDGEVIGWDTDYDDAPEPEEFDGDEWDERDDTPFMTEDFDAWNEETAQREDDWLDGSYEE